MAVGHLVQQVPGLAATGGAGAIGAKLSMKAATKAAPYLSGVYKEGLDMAAERGLKYQAAEKFAESYASRMAAQTGAGWGAAVGEGLMGAGSVASAIGEDARKEGRETGYGDYGWAVAAGLTTSAIGKYMGSKAGGDIEAKLGARMAGSSIETAGEGSFLKSVRSGFVNEGLKEEMPQSAMEQIYQNLGTGEDTFEGVGKAMGSGAVLGGLMGGAVNGLHHFSGSARDTHNIGLPGANPTAQEAQASKEGEAAANQAIDTRVNATLQAIQGSMYGAGMEEQLRAAQMARMGITHQAPQLPPPAPGTTGPLNDRVNKLAALTGNAESVTGGTNLVDRTERLQKAIKPNPNIVEKPSHAGEGYAAQQRIRAENDNTRPARVQQAIENIREEASAVPMLPAPSGKKPREGADEQAYAKRQLEKARKYFEASKGTPAEESAKGILQRAEDYYTAVMHERPASSGAISEKPSDAGRRYNAQRLAAIAREDRESKELEGYKLAAEEKTKQAKAAAGESLSEMLDRNNRGVDDTFTKIRDENSDQSKAWRDLSANQRAYVELVVASHSDPNDEKSSPAKQLKPSVVKNAIKHASTLPKNISEDELQALVNKYPSNNEVYRQMQNIMAARIAARDNATAINAVNASKSVDSPKVADDEAKKPATAKKAPAAETLKDLTPEELKNAQSNVSLLSKFNAGPKSATEKKEDAETKKKLVGVAKTSFSTGRGKDTFDAIGVASNADPVSPKKLRSLAATSTFDFEDALKNAKTPEIAATVTRAQNTYNLLSEGKLHMWVPNSDDGNYERYDEHNLPLPMIRISDKESVANYKRLKMVTAKESADIFKMMFSDLLDAYMHDLENRTDVHMWETESDVTDDELDAYIGDTTSNAEALAMLSTSSDGNQGYSISKSKDKHPIFFYHKDGATEYKDLVTGITQTLDEMSKLIVRSSSAVEDVRDDMLSAFDTLMRRAFANPLYENDKEIAPKGEFEEFFKEAPSDTRRMKYVKGFTDAEPYDVLEKKYGTPDKFPISGIGNRFITDENGVTRPMTDSKGYRVQTFVPSTNASMRRKEMWMTLCDDIGTLFAKSTRSTEDRNKLIDALFTHVKDNYFSYRNTIDGTASPKDAYLEEQRAADVVASKWLMERFRRAVTNAVVRENAYPTRWMGHTTSDGAYVRQDRYGLADGQGKGFDELATHFSRELAVPMAQQMYNKPLSKLTIEERLDTLEQIADNPYLQLRYDGKSKKYHFDISDTITEGSLVSDFDSRELLLPAWVRASGLFTEEEIQSALRDSKSELGKKLRGAWRDYYARMSGFSDGYGEVQSMQILLSNVETFQEHSLLASRLREEAFDELDSVMRAGADHRKVRPDTAIHGLTEAAEDYASAEALIQLIEADYAHRSQTGNFKSEHESRYKEKLEELRSKSTDAMAEIQRIRKYNLRRKVSAEHNDKHKSMVDVALSKVVAATAVYESSMLRIRADQFFAEVFSGVNTKRNKEVINEIADELAVAKYRVYTEAARARKNVIEKAKDQAEAFVESGMNSDKPQAGNIGATAVTILNKLHASLLSREGLFNRDRAVQWAIAQSLPHIVVNSRSAEQVDNLVQTMACFLADAPTYSDSAEGTVYSKVATKFIESQLGVRASSLKEAHARTQSSVPLEDRVSAFDKDYPFASEYNDARNGLTWPMSAEVLRQIKSLANYFNSASFKSLDNVGREKALASIQMQLQANGLPNTKTATAVEQNQIDYFHDKLVPKYVEAETIGLTDLVKTDSRFGAGINRILNNLTLVMGNRERAKSLLGSFKYVIQFTDDPTASNIIDVFDEDGNYVETRLILPNIDKLGTSVALREFCHELVHKLSAGSLDRYVSMNLGINMKYDPLNPDGYYAITKEGSNSGKAVEDIIRLLKERKDIREVCEYPIAYRTTTRFSDPSVFKEELFCQIGAMYIMYPDVRSEIDSGYPHLSKMLKKIFEGEIKNGPNNPNGPRARTSFIRGEQSTQEVRRLAGNSLSGGNNQMGTEGSGSVDGPSSNSTGGNPPGRSPVQSNVVASDSGSNGNSLEQVASPFKVTAEAKVKEAISKLPPAWQNVAYDIHRVVGGFLRSFLEKLKLGLTFTEDLAKRYAEAMPSIGKLLGVMQEKEAWQNAMQETLATFRNRFSTFDKATQTAINKCLEASTLARVWAYRPDWVSDSTWKNSVEHEKFADVKAKFDALSPEAQQFVKDAFNKNHQLFEEKMDILTDKTNKLFDDAIEKATDPEEKARLIDQKKTALARIIKLRPDADWPYMPLVRRGNHVVVARSVEMRKLMNEKEELLQRRIGETGLDPEDTKRIAELNKLITKMTSDENHYIVMFMDGQGTADQVKAKLQAKHPNMEVEAFERRVETHQDRINFMSINALEDQLTVRMDESNSDSNRKLIRRMLTMLNDIYIENLADKHSRKAEMHRADVAGYNPDMVANFLDQGYRETNFLSGVRFNKKIRDAMRSLQSEARMSDKGVDTSVRMRVYNEILKRQELDYDHKPNTFMETAQRVTSMSMLLMSPAYYLQNATQPFMMSAPYMAGKHDVTKVFSHLANDMKTIAKMYFDAKNRDGVAPNFDKMFADNPVLLAALKEARDAGRIDIGMAQDFGHLQNASAFQRFTDKFSNIARLTEMLNRVATFKTAFELEYEKEGNAADALRYADEVLYETHGNYSNNNAPRFFRQGGMGLGAEKLIFQFRKFQLIQLGMFGRLAKNAFANADKDERAIARKSLAYTLGTYMALTGMKGTPLVMLMLAAMGLGDDDDSAEDAIRKAIGDKGVSDLLLGGIPAALGMDLSNRIGAGTIHKPFPFIDNMPWEGKDAATEYAIAAGGPALSMAIRVFEGMGLAGEGELLKGFEKVAPNGLGNIARAFRFATEGYTTKNGTITIPSSEFDAMDTFFQAIGLPTTVTTDRIRLQDKVIRSEEYFAKEERLLNKAYRNATTQKERMEIQREYIALQKKRAEKGFTPKPVTQLVKNAAKVEKDAKNAVGGVVTTNTNRAFVDFWSKL